MSTMVKLSQLFHVLLTIWLLIGSLFMISSFICLALNIIADLTRTNRILTEDDLEQTKRHRFYELHVKK